MRRWCWLGLVIGGCATLASEAGDLDAVRPNAGAGPFRPVTNAELGATGGAPYLLKAKAPAFREATALALGAELGETTLYLVAEVGGVHGIYRFVASDARTFSEQPDPAAPVVAPSEPWEGTSLSAPEVARVGGEIFLYYATPTGIALARSADGVSFAKHGIVLDVSGGAAWEGSQPPHSPGFVMLGPSSFRLFFAAGGRLGEATSSDGLVFERAPGPVLEPQAGAEFDSLEVDDPDPLLAQSAEGRRIVRVYYTGRAADGSSAIGLAARFGDAGPLSRATGPALSSARKPSDPAVLALGDRALLYFTQNAGLGSTQDYRAIALAVAPATTLLPPPATSIEEDASTAP